MANRNYSSVARAATLTGSVSGSSTTMPVSETTGFPTVPFTLVVDPGRTAEEVITVTAQVGLTLTVARGQDGTTAVPHDAGATVRHMATARDFRDSAEHIDLVSGVHGTQGQVVGDIDTQVLDNKTFQAVGTDHTAIVVKQGNPQTSPLLVFQEPGGNPILSYTNNGGVVATGSQSFRPATAGATPLAVQGVSGQSAPLLSVRNQAGTQLSSIDATGRFNGPVTGDVTGNVTGSIEGAQGRFQTTGTNIPLYGLVPENGSQYPLAVRGNDVATARAGVKAPTDGWQLFHGGSANNVVPFKVFVGSVASTIGSGAITDPVSLPYGSANFDVAPIVFTQVRQDGGDAPTRRVSATIEGAPGLTSATARVFRTDSVQGAATYRVWYLAIQMMPANAIS